MTTVKRYSQIAPDLSQRETSVKGRAIGWSPYDLPIVVSNAAPRRCRGVPGWGKEEGMNQRSAPGMEAASHMRYPIVVPHDA